jgi:hypothetical protein
VNSSRDPLTFRTLAKDNTTLKDRFTILPDDFYSLETYSTIPWFVKNQFTGEETAIYSSPSQAEITTDVLNFSTRERNLTVTFNSKNQIVRPPTRHFFVSKKNLD